MKKQLEIEGTEREVNAELETACRNLLEAKDYRKAAAEAVKDSEAALQEALSAHGLEHYWLIDGERRWLFSRETVERTKVVEAVKSKSRGGDDADDPLDVSDIGESITVARRNGHAEAS